MTRLALEGNSAFVVSDSELSREGPSYTFDTLKAFTSPANELFLLIGYDNFVTFETWHRYEEIFDLATVIVIARSGAVVQPDQRLLGKIQLLDFR